MFEPRLVRPEAGNKYYITKSAGGYSPCIVGKPTDKGCNVLANCVGYALGRFHEIAGRAEFDLIQSGNAENLIGKNVRPADRCAAGAGRDHRLAKGRDAVRIRRSGALRDRRGGRHRRRHHHE